MDPPAMMNGEAYNLADIWQFPVNVINGRGGFGMGLGRFSDLIRVGGSGCDEYEEHGSRKRKDLELEEEEEEDDPFKGGDSTSNGHGNALSDGSNGDAKRIKAAGKPMGDESHEGGAGAGADQEPSSGKNAERKATEAPPKQDYIHVRARRGQATDSHSLAERARREKISERMKILQDLVPGCNKVIGKALVLDEIINYVQSLQRQVEFLSMKLEAVNTRMNPEIEVFPAKDFWHQTFDPSSMAFDSQVTRGYSRGPSPEWLHMQVGSGFERTS